MKKVLTIFLIFLFLGNAYTQDWNGNVKWVYKMVRPFPIYTESIVTSSKTNDTIINDVKCVEIDHSLFFQNENKVVKLYDEESSEFKQIYNFNLEVGDTLFSYCFSENSYTYGVINSIQEIEINGEKRIMQILTPNYGDECMLEDTLIESIGGYGFYFPQLTYWDNYPQRLLCYEDDTFSYPNGTNCEGITIGTKNLLRSKVSLFPNPFKDVLNINGEKPDRVMIYSKLGELLGTHSDFKDELDLSYLNKDIYILILEYGNQQITKKIIKISN